MYAIIFQLAFTIALLWYQRKLGYRLRAPVLTAAWEAVNLALSFIQSVTLNETWSSGTFIQAAVIGLFYLPAAFFAFLSARRHQLPIWKSLGFFLMLSFIATVIAAMLLAYIPAVQGISS